MMLILTAGLVLLSSLFIIPLFKSPTRSASLLGVYLLSITNLVLVGEIASLFNLLDSGVFFFAVHLIIAVISWSVWRYSGKPSLSDELTIIRQGFTKRYLVTIFRQFPDLVLLGVGVVVSYLVRIYLIVTVPPNSGDAMGTYMARVGYWLQHGSFTPWRTPIRTQVTYPFIPQIQILWTVLFWGNDQLAGFVQWFASLAAMVAIYGIARTLRAPRPQALFAALIWGTFTDIVLQSTSTQTDLAVTSLFVIMIYLLYLGLQKHHYRILLLSALSMALAMGTKPNGMYVLPALLITLLLVWWKQGKQTFKELLLWGTTSIGLFLLFGAYAYIQNLLMLGGLAGPPGAEASLIRKQPDLWERLKTTAIMFFRYVYGIFDITGLPPSMGEPIHKVKAGFGTWLSTLLNLPVQSTLNVTNYAKSWGFDFYWHPTYPPHEHNAWYGPLGGLLIVPSMLFQTVKGMVQKEPYRLGLGLMFLNFLFIWSFLSVWGGTEGRYFMLSVTVCAPLIAFIHKKEYPFRILSWIFIGIGLLVLGWTVTHNNLQPMFGARTIWGEDRITKQTFSFSGYTSVVRMIEHVVPEDATIGYIDFPPDYYLFGEKFLRTVIPILPKENIRNQKWLDEQKVDYILICKNRHLSSPDFGLVDAAGVCRLLNKLDGENSTEWEPSILPQMLSNNATPQEAPLLTIDDYLLNKVGVSTGLSTPSWGLEKTSGRSHLWLGSGKNQGIKGYLWSDKEQLVKIRFDVYPGPARDDFIRHLQFTMVNMAGSTSEQTEIDRKQSVVYYANLQRGRNEFSLFAMDNQSVDKLPNNDRRNLMVYIDKIEVSSPFTQTVTGPTNRPLVTISQDLYGSLGIELKETALPWSIEFAEDSSWLWLGSGDTQGLRYDLWSTERRKVELIFDVRPGPAREDRMRTVQLTLDNGTGIQTEQQKFDQVTSLSFSIELQPGRNEVIFHVLDQATILEQSNGDTRPMLVYLGHVTVRPK